MSIGMSYDEYWYANPYLAKTYYEAHKLRIQQKNQEMWFQGIYIVEALKCTVGNMLSAKGSKKLEYPKEPYDIFPKKESEKEREAEKEREKAIASLMKLQGAMQRKFNGDTKCQ